MYYRVIGQIVVFLNVKVNLRTSKMMDMLIEDIILLKGNASIIVDAFLHYL